MCYVDNVGEPSIDRCMHQSNNVFDSRHRHAYSKSRLRHCRRDNWDDHHRYGPFRCIHRLYITNGRICRSCDLTDEQTNEHQSTETGSWTWRHWPHDSSSALLTQSCLPSHICSGVKHSKVRSGGRWVTQAIESREFPTQWWPGGELTMNEKHSCAKRNTNMFFRPCHFCSHDSRRRHFQCWCNVFDSYTVLVNQNILSDWLQLKERSTSVATNRSRVSVYLSEQESMWRLGETLLWLPLFARMMISPFI
jgi:hypothetical protein